MKLKYPIIGAIIFLICHLICHFYNLYLLIWWTDIVVHFIAGVTAGLFWWWILEKFSVYNFQFSKLIQAISIVAFSTMISVFWEYWEFSNWRYAFLRNTVGQIQKQYYPYWGNNLGDIFWGMMGGVAVALIFLFLYKSKNEKT